MASLLGFLLELTMSELILSSAFKISSIMKKCEKYWYTAEKEGIIIQWRNNSAKYLLTPTATSPDVFFLFENDK